ncbi:hypothetical protein V6N12_016837 [Hibiscus sabdariffa]|uniref:Uncharacterized protein n=1 Tax=Hibiscus sabdariffa TaxID=183260 RepID=A0ABR2BPA1_9ROSI
MGKRGVVAHPYSKGFADFSHNQEGVSGIFALKFDRVNQVEVKTRFSWRLRIQEVREFVKRFVTYFAANQGTQ